jgi:HupE / UreJ protein
MSGDIDAQASSNLGRVSFLFALMLLAFATPAHAHLTPNTIIELDARAASTDVRITIPMGEIGYAYGKNSLSPDELRSHLNIQTLERSAWTLSPIRITTDTLQGQTDLIATFTASPPPGLTGRSFRLVYDGVIDKVPNHVVLVLARSDFAAGVLHGHPKMLGALQGERTELEIDLGQASRWSGFWATLRLGMAHIAEGYDHLLFLLSLLLPAPLLAAGGRWTGPAGRKQTVRHLALIVSAFTLGHSLTLIGGAFFNWSLPSQPVEIGIAISILISSIHAARPLFPGREALVAGGFGLIHGLAFATVIGSFALEPLDKAVAILGFNLGIELVQLIVVAVVLPLLLFLAARPIYARFRMGGAMMAGAASLFWLWQRV